MKLNTVLSLLYISQLIPVWAQEAAVMEEGRFALEELHQWIDQAKGNFKVWDWYDIFEPQDEDHEEIDDKGSFAGSSNIMKACAPQDCKNRYYLEETMRWVQNALDDIGVVINKNAQIMVALMIGVYALIAKLLASGNFVPIFREATRCRARGPTKSAIAAIIQMRMVTEVFGQLEAAVMNGAKIQEIYKMADTAFTDLFTAGALKLIGACGQLPEPEGWKAWEAKSRASFSSGEVKRMTRLWGSPTAEGCIAFGYREYRAPFQFVPKGMDPMTACAQAPATIKGLGFKTPLRCIDEGLKKGVVGVWYVHTKESRCMPQWSVFEDDGCRLYGKSTIASLRREVISRLRPSTGHRRLFARLSGLSHQDDWTGVCESTPALIHGELYDAPFYCEDKGILGIYGLFDAVDQQCECYCDRT